MLLSSSLSSSSWSAPAQPAAPAFAAFGSSLAALPSPVWQADQLASPQERVVSSGHAQLDAQLPGGGWPVGAITEILQAQPGLGEWRLLRPVFEQLGAQQRERQGANRGANQGANQRFDATSAAPIVLIAPPYLPHVHALQTHGIDPARLLIVRASAPADRLWATEQALRCAGFATVWSWLPQAKPDQLRRLQLAARDCDYPVFLFRPLSAAAQSSPAPLRVTLTLRGRTQLELGIVKRRGPALDAPLHVTAAAAGLAPVLAVLALAGAQAQVKTAQKPGARSVTAWVTPVHALRRAAVQAPASLSASVTALTATSSLSRVQ